MSETNEQAEKLVGVEVSNTRLTAVRLDENGALRDSHKISLSSDTEVFSQVINFITELKNRFAGFTKIGIALPGLLNRSTNRIALSTHLPENAEIDLITEIRNETGLETVLENDANAAAYGEYILGAGRGSQNMFYITIGTGVGGAFIIDGRLWRGAAGFAGEFGYIAINSEGMKLEETASAQGILRRIKNRVHQDQTSSLANIREEEITVSDVVQAANGGDAFARMMLERTGVYVGMAVANVINLLNIEKIVVGGEIMEAERIVLDSIIERTRELSFAPSFETTQIAAGELSGAAAATGAALLSAEKSREA